MKKIVFCFLFLIICFLTYCIFSSDGTYKLSSNFKYSYDQKAIFGTENCMDVPPSIEFFCYDRNFVLIKQKPKYFYDDMYKYNENYSYKKGIKESYYWVIVKTTKEVIGPNTQEDFDMIIENLNVSEKLKKKFENKNMHITQ